jgi:hypothetical protein
MDEMTLLKEFRAVVTSPRETVLAQARAQVTGDDAPGRYRPGRSWRHRPGTRGKLALTGLAGLAAAATAAAVAMAVAAPGAEAPRARAPSPAVKELAYRAAAAAATGPAVAPGQWVYWREESQAAADRSPRPAFEIWTTADGTRIAWIINGKLASFPCATPSLRSAQRCQFIGQQVVMTDDQGKNLVLVASGKVPVSYDRLRSLPRNPAALGRYLARLPLPGWGSAPVREFEVIKELLITYVMPPALTAELYQALGTIPGVTVDRSATDIAGRHGIGFKIALPPGQGGGFDELILNPATFAVMGQQLTRGPAAGARAGHIMNGTAVLKTALVSRPGKRP